MNRPALVPELYVSALERSLRFYVDLLGFVVAYQRTEEGFASIALGSAWIMLEQAPSFEVATGDQFARGEWRTAELRPPFGRGINLEVAVLDVASIAARLREAGHPPLLDTHERTYRVGQGHVTVRQLLVADPDGYLIRPSQVLGSSPAASAAP
jgi:catechol 2,3-dioxygenase-like lactoylglutathione lyase family enzyme